MRKLLLGTTAVVGAALLGASGASAQNAPTVRVGGFFDFSIGYLNDKADRNLSTGAGISQWDQRTQGEVHVLVSGTAPSGFTYGARIELEIDAVGVGSAGTTVNTDEIWGFVAAPSLGTLRFGDTDSAAGVMQVRPPRYTNFNGLRVDWVRQGGTRYMFAGLNDGADNTKIVYMSPQFFGFDFGLSFSPNGGEGEREVLGLGVSPTSTSLSVAGLQRGRVTRTDEVAGALRYRGNFSGIGIAAGFGFTTAAAPRNSNAGPGALESPIALASRTQNPTAYSAGLTFTVAGLTLGGEYTWGRYQGVGPGIAGAPKGRGDSFHWLLGAAYSIQGVTLTANYGQGRQDTDTPTRNDHNSRIIGVGATYTLAPGLGLYAYYENVRDRNLPAAIGSVAAGQSRNTEGFVVGTLLSF